jgi:hypothetical protein
MESQEPVHKLNASWLTPRQLTRLSWPCSVPTRSPRKTSHTYWISIVLLHQRAAYLAFKVVVAGKQQPAGHGKGDGRYPADGLTDLEN